MWHLPHLLCWLAGLSEPPWGPRCFYTRMEKKKRLLRGNTGRTAGFLQREGLTSLWSDCSEPGVPSMQTGLRSRPRRHPDLLPGQRQWLAQSAHTFSYLLLLYKDFIKTLFLYYVTCKLFISEWRWGCSKEISVGFVRLQQFIRAKFFCSDVGFCFWT